MKKTRGATMNLRTVQDWAVRWAAMRGQVAMITQLLEDPGVNPCARNNAAVWWAAHNGHGPVVALLLADCRVQQGLATMSAVAQPSSQPAWVHLQVAIADARRWRRRRALVLVREQRRAARDHWKRR